MASTVLITGASGGIGLELAKVFARNGHSLVLVARSEGKLKQLADELKAKFATKIRILTKDLSNPETCREVHETLKQEGIQIDVLVNNAGVGTFGPFLETGLEEELKMLDLNVVSLTYLTKLFARDMVARGRGKILNVASTAAFQPGPFMAVYYATKAYVLSLSEALDEEFRGTGVRVTTLCPGPTISGFQEAAKMEKSILLNESFTMTSAQVAEIGYRGLMQGKRLVISGVKNTLFATMVRFLPRRVVAKVIRRIQANRDK